MPEQDYRNLINQAITRNELQIELTSRDPERIEAAVRRPQFNFTDEEIEFLKGVNAFSIGEFARKTEGYWSH